MVDARGGTPNREAPPPDDAPQSAAPDRTPRPWRKRALLAALGLIAGLVFVEAGLRVAGFEFRLAPEVIDFGAPTRRQIETTFVPDPDLIWVPREYAEALDGHRRSPPQLVFMGDSCTYLGHWTRYVPELILRRSGQASMRYANVGVVGWSTYQGRRQLARDVVPLSPRVVTFYYGWNDHWVGFGMEDEQVGKVAAFSRFGLADLRIAQLGAKYWVAGDPRADARPNRVSREDFRENLTRMVRTAREHGIEPVLVTAPSGHAPDQAPQELLERFVRSAEELVPLHQGYVAIVREVAAAEEAPLCDLERDLPPPPARQKLFRSDGIHPNRAGDKAIATLMMATFEEHGLIERLFE